MRSRTRIASIVLSLILMLSVVLAACSNQGGNTSQETPSSGESNTQTNQPVEQPKPEPEKELPVIDIELMQYSLPLDDVDGIARDRIKKYIEDKFKIRLEYKTGTPDDYYSKIMTSMAAGDAADLIGGSIVSASPLKEVYADWVKEELVVNIGEMVAADPERYSALNIMLNHAYSKFYNEYVTGDPDAYYGMYVPYKVPRAFGGYIFNGNYMRALNLELPTTIDEFVNVLRAIKNGDPDGNGAKDTKPFSFLSYKGTGFYASIQPLFTSNGTQPKGFFENDAGVWEDGSISDKSKEIYTMLADWYKEGLIDAEVMTHDPLAKPIEEFVAGKTAVIDVQAPVPGQYRWVFNSYKEKYPDAVPSEDVLMLPEPLKGFTGQYATDRDAPFKSDWMWFIPSSTEHPDRVLDLLNWLVSDEGQTLLWYGIEGIHHTKDAAGKLYLIKEEYQKESMIYLPTLPDRLQYYPLSMIANGRQYFMPIEQSGDVLVAVENAQDLLTERYGSDPGLEYPLAIQKRFLEVGYKELEPYYNFVVYTEEEKAIDAKLGDIRNQWLVKFIIGQSDIRKDWDTYVAEYKAAGADQLLQAHAKGVAALKAKFDAMK